MRRILYAVILVMACATGAAAGSYEDAKFIYDQYDYTKAARLFRPLAEQGDAKAQFTLGMMYEKGQGTRRNYQTAMKYYRQAAEQGHAGSQTKLGLLYEKGRGVQENVRLAYMWYYVAAETLSGDDGKTAMKRRDIVASRMTAAQIGKAQEMARRCQQSQFKECD